ncbi:MAG: N-acyl homoserine lactonase family protein [Alphaproteobacteria bacterium]|nr:N-acyl homoserine lactonase family protein [Alphaproteobacteria bacterium]
MKFRVGKLLLGLGTIACAAMGWAWSAAAESPQGMKLYIFSSGWLNIDKSALQAGAAPGKIDIPVAFFLIHHPKGNVLFDTGNNDRVITDPTYWGPMEAMLENPSNHSRDPSVAIDAQLEKAGFKTSDINYVVLGHMHLDHAGNVSKFPTATIVYQRDEIINAFWPKPGFAGPYITTDLAPLRSKVGSNLPNAQKVIELDGDLDLFGDGSIIVHRNVGHTPGSEMALVRLPKTGPVVLTSDTCYLPENLAKDLLPSIGLAYDPAGILRGYQWIKHLRDAEGADVLMAHDAEGFKQHKHSPEYYE